MAENSFLSYILLVVFVASVLAIYDYFNKKQYLARNVKNIPIVPFLPWIGSLHLFVKELNYGYQLVNKGMKIVGADNFVAYLGHMPVYFTVDADDYQIVMPNVLERGIGYNFIDDNIEAKSLLSAKVAEWKVNRRIISKSFKERSLNRMIPIVNESAERSFDMFSQKEEAQSMFSKNLRYIMLSFFVNFFPYFILDGERGINRVLNSIKACVAIPYERFIRPWLYPKIFFNMTKMKKHVDHLNAEANLEAINAIHNARKGILDGTIEGETDDVIINLERAKTEDNIILSEFKVLSTAATHTTSVTFSIAIMCLGIHPELQERVYKEVMQVVGPTAAVDKNHLQDLKYTDMFIKEVSRLFPAIPMIMRKPTETLELGNGKVIPKDMEIGMSVFNIHRHERYWNNPLEFDPDRFLPEEVEKRHPYAYVPFSAGPRNCIGYKYGTLVLLISTAILVRKYKIHCTHKTVLDIDVKPFITLDMVDTTAVCTFTPRKNY